MLARLPLFDEAECRRAWAEVQALESYWSKRHAHLPSYTLGAAAYLDVPRHGVSTYMVRAIRANKRLRRDFDWVLQRLVARLGTLLDAPVVITRRFAVPGFHVFRYDPRLGELEPRQHFDLQALRLDFDPEDAADPSKRFSFTVPVQMPSGGAGLYVWPLELSATQGKTEAEVRAEHGHLEPEYHPYALGELFVHDGSHLHAIAADRPMHPGEARVTLQGHGLFTQGAWQLYW